MGLPSIFEDIGGLLTPNRKAIRKRLISWGKAFPEEKIPGYQDVESGLRAIVEKIRIPRKYTLPGIAEESRKRRPQLKELRKKLKGGRK